MRWRQTMRGLARGWILMLAILIALWALCSLLARALQ